MGIWQISGVALLAAISVLLLRELRTGLQVAVRVVAALVLFGAALLLYLPVVERIRSLFSLVEGRELATPILRAVGISLVAELTASVCLEMGERTIADGVLLFGRLEILLLALPMVEELAALAGELLG